MVFFTFPEDVRCNAQRVAVEFSVILSPYEGTVRVPRRSFQAARASCDPAAVLFQLSNGNGVEIECIALSL
jgi:hypothetical protein